MIAKPADQVKRVYVTVKDRKTKRSLGMTIYDATPEQVIDRLRKAMNPPQPTAATT